MKLKPVKIAEKNTRKMIIIIGVAELTINQLIVVKKKYGGVVEGKVKINQDVKQQSIKLEMMMTYFQQAIIPKRINKFVALVVNNMDMIFKIVRKIQI